MGPIENGDSLERNRRQDGYRPLLPLLVAGIYEPTAPGQLKETVGVDPSTRFVLLENDVLQALIDARKISRDHYRQNKHNHGGEAGGNYTLLHASAGEYAITTFPPNWQSGTDLRLEVNPVENPTSRRQPRVDVGTYHNHPLEPEHRFDCFSINRISTLKHGDFTPTS